MPKQIPKTAQETRTANLRAPIHIPARLGELRDEAIILACLAGSVAAEYELHDRYRPRLIGFVLKMVGDPGRTEDLVQETFVRIFRNLAQFDQTKTFTTWAHTIAERLALNELRDRRKRPTDLVRGDMQEWRDTYYGDRFNPERDCVQSDMRERVRWAVDQMHDPYREIFRLREFRGLSYAEISMVTKTRLGTVRSQLHRARISFASIMAPFVN